MPLYLIGLSHHTAPVEVRERFAFTETEIRAAYGRMRAAGVAEGVDVLKVKGVSDDVKRCVRDAVQKKSIGTPSSDPVGVTVTIRLTPES